MSIAQVAPVSHRQSPILDKERSNSVMCGRPKFEGPRTCCITVMSVCRANVVALIRMRLNPSKALSASLAWGEDSKVDIVRGCESKHNAFDIVRMSTRSRDVLMASRCREVEIELSLTHAKRSSKGVKGISDKQCAALGQSNSALLK